MVASRPLSSPPRPELSDRLLAAVAERDGALANCLLQQWVHRRGLASLEAWIAGPLLSSQGPGAPVWLRHCLEDSVPESMVVLGMAASDQALPGLLDSADRDSPVVASAVAEAPVAEFPVDDSPAPAPASLAALRAWLPDRSDDLPLAS